MVKPGLCLSGAGPGLATRGAICHTSRIMCGRFSLTLPADAVARLFGVDEQPVLVPRFNIAPGQEILAVRRTEDGAAREFASLHWGFVPGWARDPASMHRPINARAETVMGKPMFREAFQHRRCLIPADGFYEWRPGAGGKQPWRIARADGAPFAFAGLWESWRGRDGQQIESCVIITTEANDDIRPIHERMPVMLDIGRFGPWLEDSAVPASTLMEPYHGALVAYPVSRRVNDPNNDDAGIIEAVEAPARGTDVKPAEGQPKLL